MVIVAEKNCINWLERRGGHRRSDQLGHHPVVARIIEGGIGDETCSGIVDHHSGSADHPDAELLRPVGSTRNRLASVKWWAQYRARESAYVYAADGRSRWGITRNAAGGHQVVVVTGGIAAPTSAFSGQSGPRTG